ncbi:MAG: CaiB/BaiF CoA-transferase family protein [Candidatus Bathyarchaeia archaeon]|jgi:crotonobetainyl-CoA:carnitine CoA-transferase CaiB-like acyl-CoA transferase
MTNPPPLKGIRVLDLSRVLAGPFCSMTLADLGAEVIKVEMPGTGDDTRTYPPFIGSQSSYFMSTNRNKRSITLDLKTKDGQEVLHRLAARSDVVIENFRPGVTSRLAADYETLRKLNPRLIYCSISSFGQTGPYAERPGYDLIIQGMGGLMGITGEPNGPPVRIGVAITDLGAGMWATIAILAALKARERDGEGQYLDISMMDGSVAWMTYVAGNYFATGEAPPRMGSAHPSIVPYQAFVASDGKSILLGGGNDRLFVALCKGLGLPDLPKDPLYMGNENRVNNRDTLIPLLEKRFRDRPRDDWIKELEALGVPVAPVYTIDEIFADEQVRHRGMLVEINHPELGSVKQIAPAIKMSSTPCLIESPPPLLGQHTDEILRTLAGYGDEEIKSLRTRNII